MEQDGRQNKNEKLRHAARLAVRHIFRVEDACKKNSSDDHETRRCALDRFCSECAEVIERAERQQLSEGHGDGKDEH